MDGQKLIGRRGLLIGAGAGVGGLALAGIPAAASAATERDNRKEDEISGSWLATVEFGPLTPPIFPPPAESTVVYGFAAGGVLSIIVLSPAGPFPALGTWQLTGAHTFKATLWQSISSPGAPTIAVRAVSHGTFTDKRIELTSNYELFLVPTLTTPTLTTPAATGMTTSKGQRIDA